MSTKRAHASIDLSERLGPLLPFLNQLPAATAILRAPDGACIQASSAFEELCGLHEEARGDVDAAAPRGTWLLESAREALASGLGFARRGGVAAPTASADGARCELVVQPLRDGDETLGVALYARELDRQSTADVDRSILLARERAARRIAEASARRLARLQNVTAALGGAMALRDVGDVIVRNCVEAFAAQSTALLVAKDGGDHLSLVGEHALPSALAADLLRLPSASPLPIARCFRSGEAIFLESPQEMAEALGEDAAGDLARSGASALACVPLRLHDRPLGALGMRFEAPRRFTPEDRSLLVSIADLSGQAVHRAQLYEAERRAKDEALAANRLKDEFLATLSHELRTPLQSILGWSRLMRGGLPAESIPRAIESIDRNAHAQARLIADILDVSRIVTGRLRIHPRVARIASFVTSAVDTIRPAADAKGIALDCSFDGAPAELVADPDRLQQVVWNLVANAVKFTPEGGRVDVAVRAADSAVLIEVRDTGAGIAKSFLPYVFDRFRQASGGTRRSHGGLGLGLAIVRHLVELHGGTVSAESAGPGKGSTFTVRLPVRAIAPSVPESGESVSTMDVVEAAGGDLSLDGLHVLVVDDHADARELVAAALEEFGAEATTAGSADEALAALEARWPDVLVSDIGMPETDGYELLRRVRHRCAARGALLPAVALTAYARDSERAHALEAGFDVHLSKPVAPLELARSVLEVSRRG